MLPLSPSRTWRTIAWLKKIQHNFSLFSCRVGHYTTLIYIYCWRLLFLLGLSYWSPGCCQRNRGPIPLHCWGHGPSCFVVFPGPRRFPWIWFRLHCSELRQRSHFANLGSGCWTTKNLYQKTRGWKILCPFRPIWKTWTIGILASGQFSQYYWKSSWYSWKSQHFFQGNYSLQCVQVPPPMLMIDQAVSVPVSGEDRFRDDPIKLAIQSPWQKLPFFW